MSKLSKKQKKQIKKRGFDDSELWSLDVTMSEFILPRLKRFRKMGIGIPAGLTEEQWENVLDQIIYAHEIIASPLNFSWTDKKLDNSVKVGLKLFAMYYRGLWL